MDPVTEARRGMFEARFPLPESVAWCESNHSYIGLSGGAPWWLYQDRFEVWCAALDAVVIELPEPLYFTGCAGAMCESIKSTNLGLKIR
jgi:hypothetical protein